MHLTLPESDRSLLRSAESAALSLLLHAGMAWLAVALTAGGTRMPADEREARLFFLLPPDRVDARPFQMERFQLGLPGSDLDDGVRLVGPGEGLHESAHGTREGRRSGARGQIPFGPMRFVPDTAYSILEVDETVERYDWSAAPVYPSELAAMGLEGLVRTRYVVDTTGQVDTTTIEVMSSDDPRFTESVLAALGQMRFKPAKRGGRPVRQLVEQSFRFRIANLLPPVRIS